MKPRIRLLISGTFKEHWPFVLVFCFAAFFLFANLGGDYLWADEGDTAVLATSILKHGVPKAWDGVTFTDGDFGARLNDRLVMVSHPWLQYYVTAGSFFVFGENAFAARFPFALAGLLTVLLLYLLVLRVTSDKRAALSACILLTLSIQFLLFSRQCRNYSLYMFLACWLIFLFYRLTNWKTSLSFSALSIALFHSSPASLAPMGAMAVMTLFYQACRQFRKWFWLSVPTTIVFTVPWFFLATAGYNENMSFLNDRKRILPRLTQFFIECASVVPLIGVIVLFLFVWIRHRRQKKSSALSLTSGGVRKSKFARQKEKQLLQPLFESDTKMFIVMSACIFLSYGILLSMTQSRTDMWNFGLRYATPLIPLTMALVGILVAKASASNMKIWIAIMLVLGVTKFGRITPWSFLDEERGFFDRSKVVALHVPQGWVAKFFRTGLILFWKGIWEENHGTVARLCEFLKTNAAPDDVLITNYAWEPIYFHTRLPQGAKVLPHFPIYDAARKHGLPDYVFSIRGVRWIIWRPYWEGYRQPYWEELYPALIDSGATLTRVASVRETGWENRENIHFRRFPGDKYKYSWIDDPAPDAEIFRVDWPQQQSATPQSDPSS